MYKEINRTPVKKKKKNKKKAPFWLLLIVTFAAIVVIFATISYDYVMKTMESENDGPVIVDENEGVEFIVERGANTSQIAKKLHEEGLIENENIFKLLSKINGFDGTYLSGTHIVSKSLSYNDMMKVLSTEPAIRQVTIPEGKTFKELVDILYDKKIITDKEKFIKTANTEEFDYDFLKDLPPRDNKLEGYLFPDTYEFDRNAGDKEIIIKMLNNFDKKFKAEYKEKISSLKGMTVDKIVILASIIEREAKDPDDRYMISGVLYNRMNSKDKNLRKLQVDATIQYIMLKTTGAYKERLLNKDLEVKDPYNTYIYEGLPPGPICNPGEAAIKAALNPEETDYLYYVAKGDGSHEFSKTYAQHQAAIKKYRPQQ